MARVSIDPDSLLVQQSSRRVGRSMALLCCTMVLAGAGLVFAALWWKSTIDTKPDPNGHYLFVAIDPIDLAIAGLVIGVAAVMLAGLAASFFARRATAPLEEALRRQRNFVADASHELRTPLAVLDARVQHLSALTRNDDRLTGVVAELREDSRQLVGIVDDLLRLATTDPLTGDANLGEVLEKTAAELGVLAAQHGVELVVGTSELRVAVPEIALSRMLTALVDNAINHTPNGGQVAVDVTGSVVKIVDSGHGIQGIAPDRVFERFAQGTGGHRESHGIGLALVKDTISRCGGSVSVTRSDHTGTEITLTLPEAK